MRIRGTIAKGLLVALILTLVPITAFSAQKITPGSTCKVLNQKIVSQKKTYTCIKTGKKLVWNKGVVVTKPAPIPTPTPTPTPTSTSNVVPYAKFTDWGAPSQFTLENESSLKFQFKVKSNIQLSALAIKLKFKVPFSGFSIPSQEIEKSVEISLVGVEGEARTYLATVPFTALDPIGNWVWEVQKLSSQDGTVYQDSLNDVGAKLSFSRKYFGYPLAELVKPIPGVTFREFSGKELTRVAWVGKNIALLTKDENWDSETISRILKTLDLAYDSYAEITKFQPSSFSSYKGRLIIAEVDKEEMGCGGAACGNLGATGIEIQPWLLMRLYNGVKEFDQYDQALFYELGRNFWDYGSYYPVLRGNSTRGNWMDASTTGFAVFMRFLVINSNSIPGGPWDGGGGTNWVNFFNQMKSLAEIQAQSPTYNYENTFGVMKPPYSGPLSINDFWSSVVYYFLPSGNEAVTTQKFLTNLKLRPQAVTEADAVNNFIVAMSLALGRNIENEFYLSLHFGDVKGNGK